MALNPWRVQSIDEFNFFCCPECVYRSKEENSFQTHALQNHELSSTFFHHADDPKAVETALDYPNNESDIDIKEEPGENVIEMTPDFTLSEPNDADEYDQFEDFDYDQLKSEYDENKSYFDNYEQKSDFFTNNKCSKCDEKFDHLMDLAVHFNKKHDRINSRPHCPICPKSFRQISHLKDHINTNHLKISLNTYQKKKLKKEGVETLNSKLKCEYCPAFFAQKGSLERHIAKYHPEKRFSAENDPLDNSNHTCSKCGKKFTSLLNYSDHCNQEHERINNRYQCPLCPKDYNSLTNLTMHVKSDHLNVRKKCDICDKTYSLFGYQSHMQAMHESGKSDTLLKCDQCDYTSLVKRNFIKHVKIAHTKREKNLLCDQCDKKFEHSYQLKAHKLGVHEGIWLNKKPVTCKSCNEVFKTSNRYIKHHQDSHGGPPPEYSEKHMCDQCTSVFFKKDSLKTHIKNVHSDSPELFGEFMCDQCPKIFSKKHTLAVHRYRVHSNKYINRKPVEKVKCPQCEKTYKNHSYLKEHVMKEHEKNTPFACDQCSRAYGTKTALKTHIVNTHQKVKCEECNQEICNSFMLKRHKAKVHGTKNETAYQCEYCPLIYEQKGSLEKHVAKNHSNNSQWQMQTS